MADLNENAKHPAVASHKIEHPSASATVVLLLRKSAAFAEMVNLEIGPWYPLLKHLNAVEVLVLVLVLVAVMVDVVVDVAVDVGVVVIGQVSHSTGHFARACTPIASARTQSDTCTSAPQIAGSFSVLQSPGV